MRMKNPFSDEPGDEKEASGATEARAEEARAEDDSRAEPAPDDSGDETAADEPTADSGGNGGGEAGMTSAPSIGPNTVIERKPPEERLDHDKISNTDAMGKDKRREVVGGTYGPTRGRVLATFATFIAVVAALTAGLYFLAKELDAPPEENPDVAPWSQPEAPQTPPRPIQ